MDLDPKTEITLAASIMQGLLSCGHYTQPNPKGGEIKRMIRRIGPFTDWEAQGMRNAEPAMVVDDAIMLLWELNEALEAQVTPAFQREVDALTPKKPKPKPAAVRKKKAPVKKRKKQ